MRFVLARGWLLAAVCVLVGCFDSLVGSPCLSGYELVSGACVESAARPDGGLGPDGGDARVCALPEISCGGLCEDLRSDPDHCGACSRRCESGVCVDSRCVGELSGHVIAIGHDYQRFHGAMARVLGNAISLAPSPNLGLMRWRGTASPTADAGTALAVTSSLAQLGRPWHEVMSLDQAEVLLVEAQLGDGDAAAAAAAPLALAFDRFLQRGGVVIVLHGPDGVSHRFAEAGGLYSVAAPVTALDELAQVVDGNDALAQRVVSPYLAEPGSVVFPGVSSPVVTAAGEALVFHLTRY